ncbi:MAG: carboxypeptidase-like regulatory domain-containing protein, partial [Paludibacter sp.]|nr:carboxypeptidase-like regulatory domain-containing protein [Paludibacter sp.]
MKHFTFLFTFLFFCLALSAQILKGSITKANGEPIPFTTVYIHETTAGIVADEQGRFQTRLNAGTYTCEFRSLGYESQTKTIELKPEGTTLQITLVEKEIKLNELLVKP